MKLTKVRVLNFRCVLDSTDFEVAPVTCLVGKNEAGKTALLQALHKLNPDVAEAADFDQLLEYPRRYLKEYEGRAKESPANAVETTWELDEKDVRVIEERLGRGVLTSNVVVVTKGYYQGSKWTVGIDEKKVVKHRLAAASLDSADRNRYRDAGSIQELIAALEQREGPSEAEGQLLTGLKQEFPQASASTQVSQALASLLPKFVYFSRYHMMSGRVSIDGLIRDEKAGKVKDSDRVFVALLDLVGTTAEGVTQIQKSEELIASLEAAQSHISDQIFKYWTQNRDLLVKFELHSGKPGDPPPYNQGQVFETRILNKRHMVTLNFDERSTGFVWFFSFLVWFSQVRRHYGENVVILLDDPGLGLHAKAQQDLLRYIRAELEPKYQVIYTTHSPFMVDPERLLTARTVEDVVEDVAGEEYAGTKVGDRVLSTDADTVFPLQAALGYEITQSLFVGPNTLLVEGPSDLLYLKWFSSRLEEQEREGLDPAWVIAPTGGIDKIMPFMALFGANRLNVAVLTDVAAGQKRRVRDIRESDLLKDGHVLTADRYVEGSEADTEDLIGRDTYVALVNLAYGLSGRKCLDPAKAPEHARVVEEVEDHFRLLRGVPEFNHFRPAEHLTEKGAGLTDKLPGLEAAFDRFEKLFVDVNRCLPRKRARG